MNWRFKIEFLGKHAHTEPMWFETQEELDASLEFMKGCPIDDGPVEIRIIELFPTTVRQEKWG